MGDSKTITLLAMAVIGRLALKTIDFIPSVEPIVPLAVIAGLTISAEAGFTIGAAGFFLSNIVLDQGIGYWTILQALGAGLAGVIPAYIKTKKISSDAVVGYSIVGTIIYEFFVNMPDGMIFVMPFSAIHVVSSMVLGLLFASMLSVKKSNTSEHAAHGSNNHGHGNSHGGHAEHGAHNTSNGHGDSHGSGHNGDSHGAGHSGGHADHGGHGAAHGHAAHGTYGHSESGKGLERGWGISGGHGDAHGEGHGHEEHH